MSSKLEKLREKQRKLEKKIKKLEAKERKAKKEEAKKEEPKPENDNAPTVKKLKMRTATQEVYQMTYNGNFTRKEIQQISDQVSKKLEDEGTTGAVQVSIKYPTGQFRSARKSEIGEKVHLYTNEDYYDITDSSKKTKMMKEPSSFPSFRVFLFKDVE